jgi:hypothetical protein
MFTILDHFTIFSQTKPNTMENANLDFGKIILRVLVLIIVKPFVLPIQIYMNTLRNLSSHDDENSNESLLDGEFPLYVWTISLFDAGIALCYPIGVLIAFFAGMNAPFGGFMAFFGILIFTYFIPLGYGLMKELFSITLKTLSYLKKIANK